MGADVMMEEMVEVVLGKVMDVVQAEFFVFLKCGCLGEMMSSIVVIEFMVEVMVFVWYR